MSISDKIIRAVDLQKGSLPHRLGRLFATGETKGHEFQISVYDGGTPVDLTGATVLGYFTHSDSSSNEVEGGTVSGNTCTISLNAACYTRSGYFEFDIRLTKDGITHTIYYATGYMVTSYNEPIDTTPTKMTLDQIQQKIVELKTQAQAVEDSIPEDYTELTSQVEFLTDDNYEAKSGSDAFKIGRIVLSDGTENTTDETAVKRFVTTGYLEGITGIRVMYGYTAAIFVFRNDDAKTYFGCWTGTGLIKTDANRILWVSNTYLLPEIGEAYCYRIVARRDDGAEVTADDFSNVEILFGAKADKAKVDYALYVTKDLTHKSMYNTYAATNGEIGSTVDVTNLSTSTAYDGIIVPCRAGDTFTITGTGGNSPRLWAFTDENYTLLSHSSQDILVDALVLTAEHDGYFMSAHHRNNPYSLVVTQLEKAEVVGSAGSIRDAVYKTVDHTADFVNGKYIAFNTAMSQSVNADYDCITLPCKPGDKFVITGTGGAFASRLAGFFDANKNIYCTSTSNAVAVGLELVAPIDGYFACNVLNAEPYSLTATQIFKAASEETATAMQAEIDTLSAKVTAGKLESTGDATDRTAEIRAKLTANGYCELGNGEFVVENLEMPAGTELRGQGYATVLKLDTTLTSESDVAAILATSGCTIRDLAVMGADTDISFTTESTIGRRYGIDVTLYEYVDVLISNVRVSRFDHSGIRLGGRGSYPLPIIKHFKCNVSNCYIDNCFYNLQIDTNNSNANITNCHCTNGLYGAYVVSPGCQLSNCTFMDNIKGVEVSEGASFNGCLFHDENSTVNDYALVAKGITGTHPLMLNGCKFFNCGVIQLSESQRMGLFVGCSFVNMSFPITCSSTPAGILFADCLFSDDVTASGNIYEKNRTDQGAVKLKNCYMTNGTVLER